MRKMHYIVFILFCGFLLNPMDSYACSSSKKNMEEKACCDAKDNSHGDKSCCKKSNSEDKSCDGTCNNSNCSFTPVFTSLQPVLIFRIHLANETIVSKETNFFYLEKNISTHYFSVWSPPKIS
jgi:hypothetical protein